MIAGVSPLVSELKAREDAGRPVTIGLAGCGQMGTDIMVQLNRMPGLRLGAVAEVRPPQARAAAAMAGYTEDRTVYAETPAAIDAAIEKGLIAITSDPAVLARSGRVDAVRPERRGPVSTQPDLRQRQPALQRRRAAAVPGQHLATLRALRNGGPV